MSGGVRPISKAGADSVTDLLVCSICMDDYDDHDHQPKLLPCHHSFCRCCLLQLASTNNNIFIDCPTCRHRTKLPKHEHVDALQTNFYINQMRDLIGTTVPPKVKGCRQHSNKLLTHFCTTCEIEICSECCNSDHKTQTGHTTLELEEAIEEQQQMLEIEVVEAQQCLLTSAAKVQGLEAERSALFSAKEQALTDVNHHFDEFIEALNERRGQLKENIGESFKNKQESINLLVETCKKKSNSSNGLIEHSREVMDCGNISDLLAYKMKMQSKNEETRQKNEHEKGDIGNNYIKFKVATEDASFVQLLENIGGVVSDSPLPTSVKFHPSKAVVSLLTKMTLTVTSLGGKELDGYPITVDVIDSHNESIPCLVQHKNNGCYELTLRPEVSGIHIVAVQFLGINIPKSRFSLEVESNNPVEILGDFDEMNYPRAVAVDNQNNIFVVDTGNCRILHYNKKGDFTGEFPILNGSDAQNFSSCGIAINNETNTVVCPEACLQEADLDHAHTILTYTKEGHLTRRLSFKDTLCKALSVAINSTGHMIIADLELNAIFIFDKSGRFLRKFGHTGSHPGEFKHPTFVCIGKDDCIIVSDGENHRIQVFDKTGRFLYQFGRKGVKKGEFNMPFGVAADCHGNILVVDGGNKRVQIFKNQGHFIACIDSEGDKMNNPRGIAVTSDGHVWVADRDNHCIKKYKYLHCTTI